MEFRAIGSQHCNNSIEYILDVPTPVVRIAQRRRSLFIFIRLGGASVAFLKLVCVCVSTGEESRSVSVEINP